MSYDPKCEELAEYFFADCPKLRTKARVAQLALCIQDRIEDELSQWAEEEEMRDE
jgi:hypothetical protein